MLRGTPETRRPRPSRPSAMSTATARPLALLLSLFLTACATRSAPPTTPSLPPRVDCAQTHTDDPAAPPACPPAECQAVWVEYVAVLLRGWTELRRLRGVEQEL